MRTVEIPREAWVEQLNESTAIHEGCLVSLDVLGPEIGRSRKSSTCHCWASRRIASITTGRSWCP